MNCYIIFHDCKCLNCVKENILPSEKDSCCGVLLPTRIHKIVLILTYNFTHMNYFDLLILLMTFALWFPINFHPIRDANLISEFIMYERLFQ